MAPEFIQLATSIHARLPEGHDAEEQTVSYYIDPQIQAATPAEAEFLDAVRRAQDDLRLTVAVNGQLCLTGRNIWIQRPTLAEFKVGDTVPPMPANWGR
jgi:hypothetical protein